MNHSLLNAIGVGHPALEHVCNIAQGFGLAAKLTGGGGGGCAIVLVPPGQWFFPTMTGKHAQPKGEENVGS